MKTPQELKIQENREEKRQEELAQEICFGLFPGSLTSSGGTVYFNANCLFSDDKEKKSFTSENDLISEIYKRFENNVFYLNKKLQLKGWTVDREYVFDFPAKRLSLVEVVAEFSNILFLHFHLVPAK